MTPTQRTLKWLREHGYEADIVERWIPGGHGRRGVRKDCFGGLDIMAIHPEQTGVLGIQCTSGTNGSARVKKLRELLPLKVWLTSGNRIWILGWRKVLERRADGTRTKRKVQRAKRWMLAADGSVTVDEA